MIQIRRVFRSEEFVSFCHELLRIISESRAVLTALLLLICGGGWILHQVESLAFWDGQYLAFVTALTIGYGDLSPDSTAGRIVAIVLGVVGMIVMGLVVGAASVALRHVMERTRSGP